jgi:2-polyprenyl-3-methyl-5-hydroxy-6-metoxy-1,4-benzoquinol methylase
MWNSGSFSILEDYTNNPELVRRYYHRERTKYIERFVPDKMSRSSTRVLDIGCGSGVFLATLRDRGLQVQGQDLAPRAVAMGKDALHIDLRSVPLRDCDFAHSFDVVTCVDVIEHWRDPRALVRMIRALVETDAGVIIRTPNHSSWLRAVTGSRWLWYMPPAHIHHFTPKSLSLLLTQEGFRIRGIRTGASTYLFFLAYYLFGSQTGAGSGKTFLNMPRWKERLIRGLDNLVRFVASPLLIPARLVHGDAVMEIYATPAGERSVSTHVSALAVSASRT